MTAPVRLRLSRAKGFNLQAHSRAVNGLPAVNCARPGRWGNPFRIGGWFQVGSGRTGGFLWIEANPNIPGATDRFTKVESNVQAVEYFRIMRSRYPLDSRDIVALRGKNLACWCALDAPCHADVLLELANRPICEPVA